MKNLFLLPTDKPSRFVTSKENKKCYLYSIEEFKNIDKFIEYDSKSWDSQNIYITNSKEIKVGEWVIYTKGIKIHCKKLDNKEDVELANIENSGVLKIILTTDQDLILDGVQVIDDEFLEWFVKNPSCEEVEVEESNLLNTSRTYLGVDKYKIIIPKEEPKQYSKVLSENGNELFFDEQGYLIKEEAKQETLLQIANRKLMSNDWLNGAEFGAKWQQEQDNKMYSEEDMIAFGWFCREKSLTMVELLIEQFKNK